MNVFTSGYRQQPWVWQVTGLCFVLGLLLASSLQTVSSINRSGMGSVRIGVPSAAPFSRQEMNTAKYEKEIADLRAYNDKLEKASAHGSDQLKTLADELQKDKLLAGLTPVKGPGIVLYLQDSQIRPPSNRAFDAEKYIIHDVDLQQVVNELGASGAEAVAINSQRIVARTAIRCVGPAIQVNGVPVVPPFEIQAIGDPGTLSGGLNLPLGVLDGIRRYDPNMFKLEKRSLLILPAYTGSTDTRYAKPALETEKEAAR